MDLSNDMISQFAKLTTEKKDEKKESTVYGSVKIYEGKTYVKIDGSDLLTPVETTTEVKDDERVTVLIKDHNAVITGNTSDPSAGMSTTDAIVADVGKFVNLTAENFQATNATIENLKVTKAEVADLTAANALIVNLDAVKANVQDLQATNAVVENLQADKASVKDLQATNAQIENLKATKAEIHDLEATNAQVQNLKADKADIEDLYAANATIQNLQATKADIVDLNALDAEINNMSANFATIQQLNVTNAEINTLDAEVAHIQTLVNGNLTSNNIASLNLTSANTTIQNAMIKDAMIDSVTASKLTAGIIDTDVITIQSNDGSMLMTGSVQQFKDENGKVRIQIGKDGGGNFTFVLYDETGKGVLIDEEGIKSSDALADGLIVDAKVAGNANISGSKLNIASVITEVNNDHTTTIKSNKIYLDEQGQSLEVAFNSLKTQVETIQDVTIDGDLSSVVNQVQSNTTMINVNKENISTLMAENTIREEEIKNLDGEIKEVNTTLSNKYSSLQQDLYGFETTVGQTYTTKSEFNNLSVGGENYIQNGGFKGAVAGDKIIPKWTFWSDTACKVYYNNQKGNNTRPNTLYLENRSESAGGLNSQFIYKNEIAPNTTVTLSGYAYIEGNVKGLEYGIGYYDANGQRVGYNYFTYNKSGEFSHTFTTPSSYEYIVAMICHKGCTNNTGGYLVVIGELMLQKGNKATDWTPALKDVDDSINAISDNLAANYSTTSAMNSAINQKANEITSTVSRTYTTKSEFNNLSVGGRNLIMGGNFPNFSNWAVWGAPTTKEIITRDKKQWCHIVSTGNSLYQGVQQCKYASKNITIEPDTTYTFSCKAYAGNEKTNQKLAVGFHWKDADNKIIKQSWHYYTLNSDITNIVRSYVAPSGINNFNIMIGVNDDSTSYDVCFTDIKLEKGNKATDWTPAPEDVNDSINVISDNLAANYSTTSAMNSAINQKANEITSTVSQTYTTKSEFNKLSVGGRNLFPNSNFVDEVEYASLSNNKILIERLSTCENHTSKYNGNLLRVYSSQAGDNYVYLNYYIPVEPGEGYILSFDFIPCIAAASQISSSYIEMSDVNKKTISHERITHGVQSDKKRRHHIQKFTIPSNIGYIRVRFGFDSTSASWLIIDGLKFEKGNKATDWTPAPEDVDASINAVSDNLAANYSTTSQMNSAINQKVNEITSTVSQTYTTKSEFNNLSVGGENYIQNGGFKGAVAGDKIIPKWTFWGDTACKVYRNNQKNTYTRPNTLYLENKSGSEGGLSSQYIYKNEIAPDTTVTLSGYVEKELKVKGLKYGITYYDADGVTIASNYFNYEKSGEFSHTFTTPSSYESLRMSINHKGCTDGDTHYLVVIGELMLQKGNKATEWYPSSSDAEMTYATKSELTQTSDAITATFKTTGGYNLIQNSTGYGETRAWQCQGGELGYHVYTDGRNWAIGVNRFFYLNNTDKRTTEFFAYSSRFVLKPGKTYTLSGYFNMNPTVKSWEVLLLMSKTISHTESSNLTYDTAKQVGGEGTIYSEWRYYQWTFTVPDDIISGYVRIDNNGYKSDTGSTATSTLYWAALMLNEGSVALPWSPHPSECYTATTTLDSRGIRVNHSGMNGHTRMQADGFYVNNGTEDVISINANGATFKGKVTVTSGSNVPTTVLSGTISSSQLNSSITSDISTAKTNASTALSTANTAKSTADSVNTTVNNNKTNWSNAYNRVVEWASGAVTGSVTIDGGKIKANTILTDRLAISDFTNYADLNDDTASKWGWTKITLVDGLDWFQRDKIARDNPLSRTYTCSGGETFRVKGEIRTSVYGNPQNDGAGTSSPLRVSIMLIVLRSNGSRSYPASAGVTPTSTAVLYGAINSVITLPSDAISFTVYIQVNGYSNFSGKLYVRNISVCKMSGGELIVDGAITASKIAAGTITGDKIAANTISGDKISGGILSATQEIKFVGGARIFGNTGETNAGLTISAGSYSFSGASQSFMSGNWDIGGKLIVSGTLSSGAITSSGTITGTTKVGTSNAYLSSGSIYVAPWAGNLNVAYVRLTTCGYIAGYNDANYFFLKSNGDVANIYAAAVVSNGNVVTSDARKKTDIRYVNADKQSKGDTGLMSPNTNITTKDMHDFMSTIPLASYRYIDDVRNNKDFTHYGFLTQDVLYTKVGSELVAMLYDDKQIGDENDFMGYSQDKFIMFLCGALQEEIKARKELEQKLKDYIGE